LEGHLMFVVRWGGVVREMLGREMSTFKGEECSRKPKGL
jgi:hypothetical protein